MVIYEAPHRLVRTLKTLQETLGNRCISICRELTKKHETVFATTIEDALAYYDVQEPKGECVMVIEGKSREEIRNEEKARWEEMSIEEHMELYLGQGMDKKSATRFASSIMLSAPSQVFMVTPMTSYPCSFNSRAATEESTPPDNPTTTFSLFILSAFQSGL